MKSIVRSFVAILVLAGAASTTPTSSASAKSTNIATSRTSTLLVPTCPPNDPNACGLGTH
ncbi:hypothetical protein [Granulicella sp. S190]|uniref:hypothetical protein n=1 Tax=Granulicella sp. S190 TaxID=1747226 RepID=UPI00131AE9E7|nr:hypothetical protein [Granulicella sp. S190]